MNLKPNQAPPIVPHVLVVGDRVSFIQHWYGSPHQFEGVVQSLHEHAMTAVVRYEIPKHLEDGVNRPNILQSPIGLFSLTNALLPEPSFNVAEPDLKPLRLPYKGVIESPPGSLTEQINSEISHIRSQGAVAPAGVWIECGKVSGSTFRQAYWRSRDPCFTPKKGINPEAKRKKQYIGKENSAAHKVAIAQIERRNKIQKLIKQLPKNQRESA